MLDWSQIAPMFSAANLVTAIGLLFAATAWAANDPAYQAQIVNWRRNYETGLKKDNGWLTLAGLYSG